jgi:hypothetical protein
VPKLLPCHPPPPPSCGSGSGYRAASLPRWLCRGSVRTAGAKTASGLKSVRTGWVGLPGPARSAISPSRSWLAWRRSGASIALHRRFLPVLTCCLRRPRQACGSISTMLPAAVIAHQSAEGAGCRRCSAGRQLVVGQRQDGFIHHHHRQLRAFHWLARLASSSTSIQASRRRVPARPPAGSPAGKACAGAGGMFRLSCPRHRPGAGARLPGLALVVRARRRAG